MFENAFDNHQVSGSNDSENEIESASGFSWGQYYHVPDQEVCDRCDGEIRADRDGEYRQRYILEDEARSHAGRLDGKLCSECWHATEQFVRGGR